MEHPYGWLSLSPPLVAVVLAILTRRIVLSLVIGIFAGALLMADGDVVTALHATWEIHLWTALIDPGKLRVFSFTLLMGALVGVITRSGGMRGLIQIVTPWANNRRRGQLATYLLGLVVFFDDYANTILLGNTLRPICDRLRISREKLAYMVDSTSAPIAGLAIVSTWIAVELEFIAEGIAATPELQEISPFQLFLSTIPYRFYVWGALLFVPLTAILQRDFGPMHHAEQRCLQGLTERSSEQADGAAAERVSGWYHAVVPIIVTLALTVYFLYSTGAAAVSDELAAAAVGAVPADVAGTENVAPVLQQIQSAADGGRLGATVDAIDSLREQLGDAVAVEESPVFSPAITLRQIVGAADSTIALQYGSLVGLLVAMLMPWTARLMSWDELLEAAGGGAKLVLPALAVLWTASAMSRMTTDQPLEPVQVSEPYQFRDYRLYTADYFTRLLLGEGGADSSEASGALSPPLDDLSGGGPDRAPRYSAGWLPTLIFLIAAAVAFCTGTSWGTMGILIPMVFPLTRALLIRDGTEMTAEDPLLLASVGGVLAGAIFGDHCSPISDTTVLSSQSSGCDHLAHVWTQMPYALTVAAVAVLLGTIPVGMGVGVAWTLPIQAAALLAILWTFGRRTGDRTS